MPNSKHTPGPWAIDASVRTAVNAGDKHVALVNFYNSVDPSQNVSGDEHEANANLIAAAPDMAAALRPFANMLPDTYTPTDALQARLQEWCRAARAALAAAEGHRS